ncbi:MAG: SRPBCC family protein [Phenylobacterium sp.]
MPLDAPADDDRELVLVREIDAPAHALYRCWTEPELIKQWFAPKPFTTPHAETDVRPGGASKITMRSPEGQDMPNEGVYLEVVPGRRIVFTDAYTAGWVPTAQPFFTAIIEFEDLGGGRTRYTARARHWTAETAKQHEAMGFHQGWGQCADQLAELAKSL